MNDSKNLKEAHEVAACQRFLSKYNETENSHIEIVRLGDPNKKEPDCICGDNFAIELAGVYDNSYQAEKVWSVPHDKDVVQQPDDKLLSLQNLQNEIGIKLSKLNEDNYAGFPEKIFGPLRGWSGVIKNFTQINFLNSSSVNPASRMMPFNV